MASFKNTRRWPRLPIAFPVFVRSTDNEGKVTLEFATAINVSAGGVLLALRKNPASQHLSLEIPVAPVAMPEGQAPVRFIEGEVVRTELRDRYALVGLKFDTPLPILPAGDISSGSGANAG